MITKSFLWKEKLWGKEVQWALLGPTVWQRDFQVRSETCGLLSKRLRALRLQAGDSLGKCTCKSIVTRGSPLYACVHSPTFHAAFVQPGTVQVTTEFIRGVWERGGVGWGEPLPVHPQGETAAYNGKLKTGKKQQLIIFLCESLQKHRKSSTTVLLRCWHNC